MVRTTKNKESCVEPKHNVSNHSQDPFKNPQPGTSKLKDVHSVIRSEVVSEIFTNNCSSDSENSEDVETLDKPETNVCEPQKKKKRYAQKFKAEWKSQYKWMKEGTEDKPLCVACNIQIHCNTYNLKRHDACTSHKNNMAKLKNTPKIAEIFPNEQHKRHNTLLKTAELNICIFLHEHNLPFLLADHLLKFLPHICPDSEVAKSLSCSRTKATYITKECLAKQQMQEISEILKITHFSLIIDETTDIATEKSLALVVRYYDETKMTIQDRFFGLVKLKDFAAEAIFNKIVNYIEEQNIPISNLIGLAADNASVMMGKLTGVQARFKQILPNIFVLGCICHSFHLCASAATKKLPKSLEDFIRDIYNYFANSSKRIERLNECQVFVNMKPHKLLHPAQTRWLSLQVGS